MPRVLTNYVELKPIGNLGLKIGVSRAAHTQYAYIWQYPPPPPPGINPNAAD